MELCFGGHGQTSQRKRKQKRHNRSSSRLRITLAFEIAAAPVGKVYHRHVGESRFQLGHSQVRVRLGERLELARDYLVRPGLEHLYHLRSIFRLDGIEIK